MAVKMYNEGKLRGFHMERYYKGHRATDFPRWATSTVAYRALYEEVRARNDPQVTTAMHHPAPVNPQSFIAPARFNPLCCIRVFCCTCVELRQEEK